ncbi:MAG: alpha/beta fold hydrolase [Candidatus Nanohaloarchaea archaeon]
MDFSVETFGSQKTRYYESETDSSLQLVFLPGVFDSSIWSHQTNYFSQNFRTVTYECMESRDYSDQMSLMEELLEQDHIDNAVLVSQGLGNRLARELEYREEVVATVMTGARDHSMGLPRQLYSLLTKAFKREPKIFKKLFFSSLTEYQVVKQFLEDVECPEYSEYSSFRNGFRVRKPVKNALVIHAQSDPFSSLETARELKPGVSISVIRGAGTFSFYEKPQEYNKAVLDFLSTLEGFVERRKVSKTREKNRSLKEFELKVQK